tara:strand:+ start:154 stop:720 length:567 start_codon:yes stop_codon:yes gene_type:complete
MALTKIREGGVDAGIVGLVPLSVTTVTSNAANVTFDNLPTTYDNFMIVVNAHPETDNVSLYGRFLNTSGAEITDNTYGWYVDQEGTPVSTNNLSYLRFSGTIGAANYEGVRLQTTLLGRNYVAGTTDSRPPSFVGTTILGNNGGNTSGGAHVAGLDDSHQQAIRGFNFYFSSGNIAAGQFRLYGVTNP